MRLRFGGARADRAPRDEVRDVLRRQQVEELGAAGQAHAVDLEEQLPRLAQPLVDGEAAVQVRIVDEALPADGGARLLEVHAHHDEEVVGVARRGVAKLRRVFERRRRIVDRARAHDGDEAVVGAVQHAVHGLARVGHGRERVGVDRQLLQQELRRDERADRADAQVVRPFGDRPRFTPLLGLGSVPGLRSVPGLHDFHVIPPLRRDAAARPRRAHPAASRCRPIRGRRR